MQPEQFTAGYPLDAPLPWGHIDKGVTAGFLQDEYRRALGQEVTPDCRDGRCNRCGLMAQPVCQEILRGSKDIRSGSGRQEPTGPRETGTPPDPGQAAVPIAHPPALSLQEGRWVRLHYQRGEEVRWISHLDFIHVFERALRRAEWPLVYRRGVQSASLIAYGPPLPTGQISRAEYLDLMVRGDETGAHVAALAAQLPAGILIREARLLPVKPRALADEIVRALCRVTWPTLAEPEDLDARIKALMGSSEAWVTRKKENKPPRPIDVRPFIGGLTWQEGALQIVSHIVHGKTVRMEEILRLLFPDQPGRAQLAAIEREHLWMEKEGRLVTPLEAVEGGIRV